MCQISWLIGHLWQGSFAVSAHWRRVCLQVLARMAEWCRETVSIRLEGTNMCLSVGFYCLDKLAGTCLPSFPTKVLRGLCLRLVRVFLWKRIQQQAASCSVHVLCSWDAPHGPPMTSGFDCYCVLSSDPRSLAQAAILKCNRPSYSFLALQADQTLIVFCWMCQAAIVGTAIFVFLFAVWWKVFKNVVFKMFFKRTMFSFLRRVTTEES